MYCVFQHISGHLPRQIEFWLIWIKSWDWVRPPTPQSLGLNPNLNQKIFYKLPLTDNANRAFQGNVVTIASCATWWPNMQLMQVVPSGGQICN